MRPHGMFLIAATLLVSVTSCKRSAEPAHQEEQEEHQGKEHQERHREWNLPPVGASVKVSLDGKPVEVALASLSAEGMPGSVAFAQLWKTAWPAEDPAKLHFDLVGSDGFRPASKPKCSRLLTGAELSSARLEVATHNLVLDEALKLPGCYRVRAVVGIEATR